MILVNRLPYEEWLAWRMEGLGGSDAATIMGVSRFENVFELFSRRTGRLAPKAENPAMRRGKRMEAPARKEYERLTGIRMPAALGIHDDHTWLRATFDGYNAEARRLLEIKCPGKKDHRAACRGEIPVYYKWQLVHLMMVADIDVVDYFSFDGKTSALITFERNAVMEKQLFAKERAFWKRLETDMPPPIETALTKTVRSALKADSLFPIRRNRR